MSETPTRLQMFVAQSSVWLLRLAIHPLLSRSLQHDAVAFAAWYAAVGSLLQWPDEVVRIQESERGKRLSLDRMMRLLARLDHTFSGRTTAEHARLVLEGYAVHDWVGHHPRAFTSLAEALHDQLACLGKMQGCLVEAGSPFAARLAELGRTLQLSALEQDILAFAFWTTVSDELSGIFEQLAADSRTAGVLWTALFQAKADELTRAIRPSSPLRLSGILCGTGRRARFATVEPFWVDLLARADSLADALLEPYDHKSGSGRPARLLEEDLSLAVRLLKNAGEPGVNLLLYGDASLDQRQLLREIVTGCGRAAWRVRQFEEAPRAVLPSLTFVAFQLLARRKEPAILVIERPAEVLQTCGPPALRTLFGIELTPGQSLPFDENLLTTNPVPAMWLSCDVGALPEATIARFVFHAPLKRADRAVQALAMRERLRKLRLGRIATAQILELDGVSAAQLESAAKAARLAAARSRSERGRAIVQAVRRSQRALSRDVTERFRPSITAYSLTYLNTAGRFSPEQILASLRRRPRGSLLLYGPPGTGKTQFVEYLATQLALPLVRKSAADLLSKWVGDSEKNIAAAFAEAATEDAILFFDEGDGFLRSRNLAQAGWEVTQTNELLQRMERFDGIVTVATNLFRNLDAAALRRFTFKIEFRELDLSQRWKMFLAEAGMSEKIAAVDAGTREEWEKRLLFMKDLTPGDFATVKRQCVVLDTALTPEGWLEQLELECKIKSTHQEP
ncbi:MAG TPA: ATP-binding protein [Steroidobacteraceae bacterium]|nr:ATP-binding protein [Steroidobacteraceae bacterium]